MNVHVSIRTLQSGDYPAWDQLVHESKDGTVYHESWWLDAVSRLTQTPCVVYGAYAGSRLIAGVPFCLRRRGPLTIARRPWATPYANCVFAAGACEDQNMAERLLHQVARDCSQVTYTASPFSKAQPMGPAWKVRQRGTFMLDIADTQRVWSEVVYQLRKKIRKAQRNGLVSAGPCPPDVFYDLYSKTFNRRGITVPFSRSRFGKFWAQLDAGKRARSCLIVDGNGTHCAAGLALLDNKRAYYALAGTDVDSSLLPASALLTWEIIKEVAPSCASFDLVGANIEGVVRFKKQFSPTLVEYAEATAYRSLPERLAMLSYGLVRRALRW